MKYRATITIVHSPLFMRVIKMAALGARNTERHDNRNKDETEMLNMNECAISRKCFKQLFKQC